MKISVFNLKGGVGKTSLAFSLAKDLDFYLISNDDSTIEKLYKKAKIMKKVAWIEENCIYDFGGFVDKNALEVINKSDFVVIPFFSDINSMKKTIISINEISNKNIILVAMNSDNDDFSEIIKYLEIKYSFPIFEIKKSRIWLKSFEANKSVLEIKNETSFNRYVYRNSLLSYEKLLKRVQNEKN